MAKSAASDMATASAQWDRYVRARDNSGHRSYMATARKCDKYYQGEQWEAEDIAELTEAGRPALTLPIILPIVNTILGEQISRRADVKYKPKKGGTEEVANILNKLYMHVTAENSYQWVENQVFADGLIIDRGYFDVRIDFSDNIQGEIRIVSKDPLTIIPDPDATEYDPETWNEVFETRLVTLEDVEQIYGKKKANQIRFLVDGSNYYPEDSIEFMPDSFGNAVDMPAGVQYVLPAGSDERTIKSVRLIERQHKKLSRVDFFVDQRTGDQREVPNNWSEKQVAAFAKKFGLGVISKVKKRVRWTVTCDKVVLHDDWSPYDDFTIIPYFAFFRRGRPFGVVRNLLSAQEQLNKISSQELHIVNTTANSGWIVQTGSLANMDVEDLEKLGSKTGVVIEYHKGFDAPDKITPNTIPTGLDRIGIKAQQHLKTISGVSDAMLGTEGAEVSGVALESKQARGAVMIQVPLDNLTRTRHMVAKRILKLIQQFYTEERVIQITRDDDPEEGREEIAINQMSPEGMVVNDLTVGEYAVVVGSAPSRDSFDEVQFAEALNLRKIGVAIPDDVIVMHSHLADKGALAKRLRIQNGVEMTPEQQQMQQLQSQLALAMAERELAELDAKIAKMESETQLNYAKVQDLSQTQPILKLQELKDEREKRANEIQLRRDLAAVSERAKERQLQVGSATKLASTAMQTAARKKESVLASTPKKGSK